MSWYKEIHTYHKWDNNKFTSKTIALSQEGQNSADVMRSVKQTSYFKT